MTIPDWQLPPGVDRGLWDYLHSGEMVAGYDAAMAVSALSTVDVAFCEKHFVHPGRLIDLGCGTGRLAHHFAAKGFDCVGIDLSEEMLSAARETTSRAEFRSGNLTDLVEIPTASFDWAACLFSTLGMIRGRELQRKAIGEFHRILKPGGTLVLHVHNRHFVRELGLQGIRSGEIAMPQAYGGAPLTLTHFSHGEIRQQLTESGFTISDMLPISSTSLGKLSMRWLLPGLRAYGYLIAAKSSDQTI